MGSNTDEIGSSSAESGSPGMGRRSALRLAGVGGALPPLETFVLQRPRSDHR